MYINDQYNNIVYILYTADISKEKKNNISNHKQQQVNKAKYNHVNFWVYYSGSIERVLTEWWTENPGFSDEFCLSEVYTHATLVYITVCFSSNIYVL